MSEIYAWVPWFAELCQRIADGDDADLARRAKQVKWKADGTPSPLLNYDDENIDPFSFLYTVATGYRYPDNRTRLHDTVNTAFGLSSTLPVDCEDAFIFPQGLPLNTLFHKGGVGNPGLLWRLFRSVLRGTRAIDPDHFNGALDIGNVGLPKLTQTLFLIDPTEYMPLDDGTRKVLTDPEVKIDNWDGYQAVLAEFHATFPGCDFYEANLFAWLFHSGNLSVGQHVWQVSTNVYNDKQDRWEEFAAENAVWTGGPGPRSGGWDDYTPDTSLDRTYPLTLPTPGDLILVRFASHGRGIGIVHRNDYATELSARSRLRVVWLNRTTVPDLLTAPRGSGFMRANTNAETFFAHDAYRPTDHLLRRLQNSAGANAANSAEGLTREAVLRAIGQFDDLGRDAFLAQYGYAASRNLWIAHEGRRYDMKAVWAAAHVAPGTELPVPMPEANHSRMVKKQLEGLGFAIDDDLADTPFVAKVAPLNQILYGPPGTGKTWRTVDLAVGIVDNVANAGHDVDRFADLRFDPSTRTGNIALVTFHQNVAYEDFVEGIRPILDASELRYELRDGLFKRVTQAAVERPNERFVLIIDEINRGNIAKIFGELITLIEESRRIGEPEHTIVALPHSRETFDVPPNLYLIGTMNTADRSIQLLDTALRRRFTFRECMPEPSHAGVPVNLGGVDCRQLLRALNDRIVMLMDREHQIGHTYFLHLQDLGELASAFRDQVFPLLQEYFFDDWSKIRAVLANNAFVTERSPDVPFPAPDLVDEGRKIYERLPDADERWLSADQYQIIYRT